MNTKSDGKMHRFFYTFGTDSMFPYSEKDFVEVHADTKQEADAKYRAVIPNRQGSNVLNCAFVYTEDEWINGGIRDEHYKGRLPAKIIERKEGKL